MNDLITRVWGETHKGCVRRENQDRFLIKKIASGVLLAVADGVRGNSGGAVAAQAVIDAVQHFNFPPTVLENELRLAVSEGETKIKEMAVEQPNLEGMGTTLTLIAVTGGTARWVHVGDSRLYRFSRGRLTQVTTDHTFIQDLINDGVLTLQQAAEHPLRNVLDRCVGMDNIRPDSGEFRIREDDCLLLCSDGLNRHLPNGEIASCLKKGLADRTGAASMVKALLTAALDKGGRDNITVIVFLAGQNHTEK